MKVKITEQQLRLLVEQIVEQGSTDDTPTLLGEVDERTLKFYQKYITTERIKNYRTYLRLKKTNTSQFDYKEQQIINRIQNCKQEAIKYFETLFSNPITLNKLSNQNNVTTTLDAIKNVPIFVGSNVEGDGVAIYTNEETPIKFIIIDVEASNICRTVRHEIGHIVDKHLRYNRETTIENPKHYHKNPGTEFYDYVQDAEENYTRVQGLRKYFNVGLEDDGYQISEKISIFLNKYFSPNDLVKSFKNNGNIIVFETTEKFKQIARTKSTLFTIGLLYDAIFDNHEIALLLSQFTFFDKSQNKITLNCNMLSNTNMKTVQNKTPNVYSSMA